MGTDQAYMEVLALLLAAGGWWEVEHSLRWLKRGGKEGGDVEGTGDW